MSKFQILSCAVFLLFINSVKAQSVNAFVPDTANHFEIGTNLAPLIAVALGAEAPHNYTLCLRKQHNKTAFQIEAVYYQASENSSYIPNVTFEDSVVTQTQKYSEPQKYVGIAAGMEFYNPNKKIRWYWGFDILGRYYINEVSQTNSVYAGNSYINPTPPGSTVTNGTITTSQWGAGASIKGGLRIPLSKKFALQTETHLEGVYLFAASEKITGDITGLYANTGSSFDIDMQALIPEVTLYYRF